MDAPNAKRRACLGKFGRPAPPTTVVAPQAVVAPTTTETLAAPTIAQMLPEPIFKSTRCARFAMPILSKAESGTLKSFRKQGTVPGPPFTFAFQSINFNGESRPAASFGFMGYLELPPNGPVAGSVGKILSPSPSLKIFGNSAYPDAERTTLVTEASTLPMTALATAWQDLELAKAPLVVNTEAFFFTPKLEQAIQIASLDQTFGPSTACFSLTKSRQGLECVGSPASRTFAPSLSRYVLVLNPPTDAKFGVRVASVTGGTVTDRGTTRPFKLVLTHAGKKDSAQEVTLWSSDASAIFGKVPDLNEFLKTASAILLISGAPSDNDKGCEFTVRAGCMAVEETDFLAVNSDAIKSLFNGVAHDAQLMQSGQSKMSYAKSIEAVLKEGRVVPLAVQRASCAEVILINKNNAFNLVRTAAKVEPGDDEGTKEVAKAVPSSTDDQMLVAIEAMDKTVAKAGSFETAREKMIELIEEDIDGGTDLNQVKVALVALSAFEGLDKEGALALCAMVKRCATPAVESEAEDEDLVPGDEEEEEYLCAGL